MKTRNLLLTLGTAALTVAAFNATAADALLTPRAAGNQIKTVAGFNNDANLVKTTGITVSPRAAGNQLQTVAGTNSDVNPATLCAKNMAGSPKVVAECASHTTMLGCTSVKAK